MEGNNMTNEQLLPIINKVMDKLMNLGGADYDREKNTSSLCVKKYSAVTSQIFSWILSVSDLLAILTSC